MSTVFTLVEAESCLSQLVDRAANGEENIIAKGGKAVARLVAPAASAPVPTVSPRLPRVPGGWEGLVWVSEDFDDPLPANLQARDENLQLVTVDRKFAAYDVDLLWANHENR